MKEMLEAKIEGKQFDLKAKTFKTGSTGYHGFGKIVLEDGKYQVNILVIKIGSKEQAVRSGMNLEEDKDA